MTVAPRGLHPHRLFSLSAIAWALALWAVARLAASLVRSRVSPWKHVGACAAARWSQLRRWAAAAGTLFPRARLDLRGRAGRAAAAYVAQVLRGFAPPTTRTEVVTTTVLLAAVHAV